MTEKAAVAISVARNSGSMPSQLIEIVARKYLLLEIVTVRKYQPLGIEVVGNINCKG